MQLHNDFQYEWFKVLCSVNIYRFSRSSKQLVTSDHFARLAYVQVTKFNDVH